MRNTASALARLRTPLLLAATLSSLAVLVPALLLDRPTTLAIAAPSLTASEMPCDASVEATAERAQRAEASALAKIARYPFAPAEGIFALTLLDEAERCYRRAREPEGRERASARKQTWRAHMERDYRDHLVRYERALAADRPALARRDIAFLLELLSQQDGPFAQQLRKLERELDAPTDSERSR